MRVCCGVSAWLFLGALLVEPFASENFRLLCEYTHKIDEQGKSSPVSGEKLITAFKNENGIAIIKKEGFDRELSGSISDEEIKGEVEYKYGEIVVTESIFINRYSGRLVTTFSASQKTILTHFGKCRYASSKLF